MLNIYADLISQPARAVVGLCKLAKIQYNLIELRIFKGEAKTEEYKEIHPEQKVPAILDGKFSLFESHAILRYLCNSREIADHYYPRTDYKKRAMIDAYLDWHHQNTRLNCISLLLQTNVPHLVEYKKDLNDLNKNLDKTLKFFENYWLKEKNYIGGMEQLSIADLSAYCEIYQLNLMSFDFSKYPQLVKWMKKVGSIQEIAEVHETVNKIRDKKNKPKM